MMAKKTLLLNQSGLREAAVAFPEVVVVVTERP